ncbi:MAG: 3-hydroxybutyryl-CoA dehydrogenase [Bdellovibrionales bacterium]|nr:3-hydroxybutyryl-CoA dehydrogenase [Bdellovibrionales bacterium]
MHIKNIGIVGAGQMGAGIAQVCAQNGFETILYDIQVELAEKGQSVIAKNLDRLVEKEKITIEQKKEAMARLKIATDLKTLVTTQLVIEAATENEKIKLDIFESLDQVCPKEAILASNTSSIPITKIASVTKRPQNVIGMHFMNPVPVMKLVEIIKGLLTSEETYTSIFDMTRALKKESVLVEDFPGFLVNRILCPMINEAVFALESGISTAEDIDKAMKLGTNQPMGPLELADFIGLDTCLAIMKVLHEGLGEDKFRPAPLLRKYVQAGLLGRKTGRGFYKY